MGVTYLSYIFAVVLFFVMDMEYATVEWTGVVSEPEACTRVQINGLLTKIGSVTKAEQHCQNT